MYAKGNIHLSAAWNAYVDVQFRTVGYRMLGTADKFLPLDSDNTYSFFNPKFGLTHQISEKSKVSLDIKAVVGAVAGIISIAGVWFTLTAEIAQLQLDVIRMQDAVKLNEEFRVKWPRGEMGALPDDAKQDLKIIYLQDDVNQLKYIVKALEIDNAKK